MHRAGPDKLISLLREYNEIIFVFIYVLWYTERLNTITHIVLVFSDVPGSVTVRCSEAN